MPGEHFLIKQINKLSFLETLSFGGVPPGLQLCGAARLWPGVPSTTVPPAGEGGSSRARDMGHGWWQGPVPALSWRWAGTVFPLQPSWARGREEMRAPLGSWSRTSFLHPMGFYIMCRSTEITAVLGRGAQGKCGKFLLLLMQRGSWTECLQPIGDGAGHGCQHPTPCWNAPLLTPWCWPCWHRAVPGLAVLPPARSVFESPCPEPGSGEREDRQMTSSWTSSPALTSRGLLG